MRKNTLRYLLLLCLMALPIVASAQVLALRQFAKNIYDFNTVFPQEKVYLQLDNTGYFQGETIWFKAYVVQSALLTRSTSGVLYVELLSPSGVVLQQKKLKIAYGQCDGSIDLVDMSTKQAREMRGAVNYPSGFYEIRAYTLNMLNFNQESLFSRIIPVFEKPSNEGGYYEGNPIIKETKSDIEQYRPKMEKLKTLNVSFYPEGGNLIIGLPGRVAFKAIDEEGRGVSIQGVLNNVSEQVGFVSEHDGMGSFTFVPSQRSNSVSIEFEGKKYNYSLPNAEQSGIVMSVDTKSKDVISAQIESNMIQSNDSLGLTLTCRGELLFFKTIAQKTGIEKVDIVTSDFPAGVCQLTLFTSEGKIIAKRTLFNNKNVSSPTLRFETDKTSYSPFDKVNVKFSLSDTKGIPFADRFCVSIRDNRSFGTNYADNLKTDLLLSSDLRGYINNPSYYFEVDDVEHNNALDLLMMIQGWERYDWNIMSGVEPFNEKHRIEKGLTYNGWIVNKRGTNVVSGIKVLSAVVPTDKKHVDQFSYITDKNGYFGFDLTEFYGEATLTMTIRKIFSDKLANSKILLERSIEPEVRPFDNEELLFNSFQVSTKVEDLTKREIDKTDENDFPTIIEEDKGILLDAVNIESHRKYIDYYTFKAFDAVKESESEYDKGEYTTDVYSFLLSKGYPIWEDDSVKPIVKKSSSSDQKSVSSEDEIAAEFISVSDGETTNRLKSASDNWYLGNSKLLWYVHDSKQCRYVGIFEKPNTIDMDYVRSVVVYDKPVPAGNVFDLTPLLVSQFSRDAGESLELFKSDFASSAQNYCVVDILLKDDYELKTKSELRTLNKRITTVKGYSELRDYYSPAYPDGPIPGDEDYRRTLYWNPNVISDKNGNAEIEFYNNSITKSFSISGCGITYNGQPYVLDSEF